jgi:hypothetical protein
LFAPRKQLQRGQYNVNWVGPGRESERVKKIHSYREPKLWENKDKKASYQQRHAASASSAHGCRNILGPIRPNVERQLGLHFLTACTILLWRIKLTWPESPTSIICRAIEYRIGQESWQNHVVRKHAGKGVRRQNYAGHCVLNIIGTKEACLIQ